MFYDVLFVWVIRAAKRTGLFTSYYTKEWSDVCLFVCGCVTFSRERCKMLLAPVCMYVAWCGSATQLFVARDYSTHWATRKRKQPETRFKIAFSFTCQWNCNLLTLLKSDIYISELYSRFALCKMVAEMLRMRMRSRSSLICRICEIRKYLQRWDTAISVVVPAYTN